MSTDLDIRPDLSHGDTDDNLCHIVCSCSPDIALCGVSVPENEMVEDFDDDRTCKRCLELEGETCILCGHNYCEKCGR